MFVAIGVLAASVVVFVPIAMAGWHLTSNKVLFFSATLFILLTAAVHLLPYASSFSSLLFRSRVTLVVPTPTNCLRYLYHTDWHKNSSQPLHEHNNNVSWSWSKPALSACNFHKLPRNRALEFLRGSWIVVAGDSQARFFLVALLQLLLENPAPVTSKLFKYHSNFDYYLEEYQLRTDFIWAPYTTNLTTFTDELHRNGTYPDVMIVGAGLWHMLHFTNASEYGTDLAILRKSMLSSPRPLYLFWLNLPRLVPSLLNTEAKRVRMTPELLSAYDRELVRSKLIFPEGPCRLLDVKRVTRSCGADCTADGMHYVEAVYDAALQMMLQILVSLRS